MRVAENAGNGNGRQHCHQNLKYFNFLPSSATKFTTGSCKTLQENMPDLVNEKLIALVQYLELYLPLPENIPRCSMKS